jgi:hypothetical protein
VQLVSWLKINFAEISDDGQAAICDAKVRDVSLLPHTVSGKLSTALEWTVVFIGMDP